MQFLSWFLAGLVGWTPNRSIRKTVAVSVVAEAMSVVATVGTVSKTMVAKAVVSVVGISSSLSLRGSGGLGISGPLAVVSVVAVGVGVYVSVSTESVSVAVVAKAVVSVVGISLGLGLSNSGGLGAHVLCV